jgi:flagellar hook-length control protein FliK
MQTAPLTLAVTVASVVGKQLCGSSKINSASKDEALTQHASSFKKAFRQALADNSTPQSERSILPDTETELAAGPVAADPDLTGMLSPALQALVDSLPRPDNAALVTAASVTVQNAGTAGLSAEPAAATPLAASASALAAVSGNAANAANAETVAQPAITAGTATNTPRLQAAAADATVSTAVPAFKLPDLTADAALPVAASLAAQNPPPAEVLLATSALATPNQTAGSPATASHIATRVGAPEWDKAFGQQLVWISKSSSEGSSQSASLSLNPPELGPIKIVLQISDAQAYASFSSAQPEVRQAIENALPKLRDMLGESGLQLAQADINSGSPQQQQDEAEFQQSKHSRHAAEIRSASQQLADTEKQADSIVSVSTLAGRALVDIFA